MKLNRLTAVALCVTLSVCLCSAFKELFEDDEHKDKPVLHQNHPRIFGIFSKPPEPDTPKQTGHTGIMGHLGNVLQGGTIGIQLQPLRPLHGLVGHAKKIISGVHGTVGRPFQEKPEQPKTDHWEKDPEDDWEMKKPPKVITEPVKPEPVKPEPEGYDWDDIGEDNDGHSTEVPIEDIINPRRRPKRFIESKIYHVALEFRTNGKPYKVVEKTKNTVESKEKL